MNGEYRPDVDGLRAIAVGLVLVFHANLGLFPGGYVGVDVFFVISGYLITGILLRQIETGQFSLLNFYERRIRRILPALCVVLAASLVAALFILLPSELEAFARSMNSAVLFISNFHFLEQANYFAGASWQKPLLHTWSLSVEEQFYLIWPLVIWALHRRQLRLALVWSMAVLGLLSLAAAELLLRTSPNAAFYMFPTRIWELLLGASLAIRGVPSLRNRPLREAAGIAGLGLILGSALLFYPGMHFPGLAALLPCVGAALLIHCGGSGSCMAARLLSSRPFVAVGLVSYSLYLWHWPIFSLYQIATDTVLGRRTGLILILVSLALAGLTWRYVETPFRHRPQASRMTIGRRQVLSGGVLAILLFVLAGLLIMVTEGLPQRLPETARSVALYQDEASIPRLGCIVGEQVPTDIETGCLYRNPVDRQAQVLLWGDSHAMHFAKTLEDRLARQDHQLILAGITACLPLPGLHAYVAGKTEDVRCQPFNDAVLEAVLRNPNLEWVIVAGRWHRSNANYRSADDGQWYQGVAAMRHALEYTASRLESRGIRILVLGQAPEFPVSANRCLTQALWSGDDPGQCSVRHDTLRQARAEFESMIYGLMTQHRGVYYYDPLSSLCMEGDCGVQQNGLPLYKDRHHLTQPGSRLALSQLDLNALLRKVQ